MPNVDYGNPLNEFWTKFMGAEQRAGYPGQLQGYLDQYMQRQGPQAGAAAQAQVSPMASNQRELVGRLEAMASGRGPSVAAEQLRAATDRNQAAQASITSGGRGNAGLAGVMASNTSAQLGQNASQQAVQGRLAEQQMALGQLGGVINQGRASDEGHSQFNALQTNYRDQANLDAKLRSMGLNDAMIQNILKEMGAALQAPTGMESLVGMGASAIGMGARAGGSGK